MSTGPSNRAGIANTTIPNATVANAAAGQGAFLTDRLSSKNQFLLLLVSVLLVGVSCHRPIRTGTLIDAYRTAACVAPVYAKGVEPPTRGWDAEIAIAGGSKAKVQGAEMVWGTIVIRYDADGREVTAVDAGDYIYPTDVRLNDAHNRLYVKASGAAAGIWEQTWLYEYDLLGRKQVRKNRVQPDALPPECVMLKK